MSKREKWTLAVLVMISVWLFADQNAMNPVVREIMAEYQIDERQIGIIGSAFTILGALVSMFFGYFTDRFSRKKLLAFTVLLGEIPCFMTGLKAFTSTYEQLLTLRILTGLGVGGIFPITFSLVGDYFSTEHRATAVAFVSTAWGIGEMLGQVMPGFLAGTYGWRLPFMLAAAPNFVLVPVFLLIAREPKRGARERELADLLKQGFEYTERIKLRDLKAVFANRTNLLGFVQGVPGSIPWGLIPFFLIPFYEGKGFTKEFATTLTLVLGLGATAGGLLGGWAGDRIFQRLPKALPLFCAGAVLAGVGPGYVIMNMQLRPDIGLGALMIPVIASLLTGVIVTIPSANIKAMLINVNPPERRGSVFGIHNIADSLGRGIGPFLGGMLIRSHGYLYAMLFAIFMWIPCAVLYAAMALTIEGDLRSLGRYLQEKRAKIAGVGINA